jgi:para-nitrobenzyl esterase
MASDTIVTTTYGPVRGETDGSVRSWKGIRYAAPPTGDLRWRAPRRPEPWTDVADATRFGPVPVQTPSPAIRLPEGSVQSEDCLTLNVWAAEGVTPHHQRPVMVWVHGGAYMFGSTAQQLYDGRSLAANGEIVLVTVGYRLGALGFADLSRFSTDTETFETNVSLRDILFALAWVRDNITAFGGDPDSVTLFGESAGAGIVTTLMTSPAARGLFHRAIAESSPATSVYGQDRAERVVRELLQTVEADPDSPSSFRAIPADRLAAAAMTVYAATPLDEPGTLAFTPVVDGELVPEHPVDVFARGDALPVPLLIGTNHDETSLFTMMKSPLMPVSRDAIEAMSADLRVDRPDLDIPTDAEILSAYAGLRVKKQGPAISRDLGFRMPTLWVVQGHAAVAPTYLYRFDWATPMLRLLGIGATHATELPYLWGNMRGGKKDITFRLGGERTGHRLSRRFQQRWIGFAVAGSPQADGAVRWDPYTATGRATLVIDRVDRTMPDLDGDLRTAWGDEVLSFT